MTENSDYDGFLNEFPMNAKNNYKWKIISSESTFDNERANKVYQGTNKNVSNDIIFVKQIYIEITNIDEKKQIYKELYLNYCLKNYDYFIKNVELLISKNKKFIFLIM